MQLERKQEEEKKLEPVSNWHTLISVITNQNNFTVETKDEELVITTQDSKFAEKFKQALESPDDLQAALPLSLIPTKTIPEKKSTDSKIKENQKKLNEFEDLIDSPDLIYHRFFALDSVRLGQINWVKNPNGILIYKFDDEMKDFYQALINLLQGGLSYATREQLLEALVSDKNPISFLKIIPKKNEQRPHGPLAPVTKNIIGCKINDTGDEHHLFFNSRYLIQALQRPCISSIPQSDPEETGAPATYKIRCGKQHFNNYIYTCLNSSKMLLQRITGSESEPDLARPIIMTPTQEQTTQPDLHFVLALDCSGSMHGYWTETTQKTLECIGKLRELSPTATIEIIPFQDEKLNSSGILPIMDSTVETFIGQQKPRGQTPLYAAINKGYQSFEEKKHRNAVLIVVTDGENTTKYSERQSTLQNIKKAVKTFILPLGETQDSILKEFKDFGALLLEKNNVDGLVSHAKLMGLPTQLTQLYYKLQKDSEEQLVQELALMGEPHVLPGTLPVGSTLRVGDQGQEYQVSLTPAPATHSLNSDLPLPTQSTNSSGWWKSHSGSSTSSASSTSSSTQTVPTPATSLLNQIFGS